MNKYIKIIFTISILLNLVLIGVVGGGAYKKYQWSKDREERFASSPVIKSKMKENIEKNRASMKQNFTAMKREREALKNIIEAKDFDRTLFEKQVSKIESLKTEMGGVKAKAMGDTLESLSYEDRLEFSRHALKMLSSHKKKEQRREHSKPQKERQN